MNFIKTISFIILIGLNISCQTLDCDKLDRNFKSYDVALNTIKSTNFYLTEECRTTKSSWISQAKYFSCSGQSGYLLITTEKKTYIHENVPIGLWNEFKRAKSFGEFYHSKIKRNYLLIL